MRLLKSHGQTILFFCCVIHDARQRKRQHRYHVWHRATNWKQGKHNQRHVFNKMRRQGSEPPAVQVSNKGNGSPNELISSVRVSKIPVQHASNSPTAPLTYGHLPQTDEWGTIASQWRYHGWAASARGSDTGSCTLANAVNSIFFCRIQAVFIKHGFQRARFVALQPFSELVLCICAGEELAIFGTCGHGRRVK